MTVELFMKHLLALLLLIASARASTLQVAWQDNSSDETGFIIERSIGAGSVLFTEVARTAANVTMFTEANLVPDQIYNYRVRAFNAAGASAPSNTAVGSTGAPLPQQPPNAPSGTTVIQITVTIAPPPPTQ